MNVVMMLVLLGVLAAATANTVDTATRGLHLALAGDPSRMAISWMTNNITDTYVAACAYGTTKGGPYDRNATGTTSSYFISWQHGVVLVDLVPAQRVYYRCGDATTGPDGPERSFTAAQAADPTATSAVHAIVYGDMGVTNSNATLARVKQRAASSSDPPLDFVFHLGDISYADDITWVGSNPKYEQVLDHFMNEMIEPVASAFPYFVLPGNHDASCHAVWNLGCSKKLTNFSAYRHRWRMPWRESGTNTSENMWYSFDIGHAHVTVVSTESDFHGAPSMGLSPVPGPFGDQMTWLAADLAAANEPAARAKRPWVIVAGHRPVYTSSGPDWPLGQLKKTRANFEPLLIAHNVSLYLGAHVHSYERMFPTRNGKKVGSTYVNANATVYLTHGCAGNKEGHEKLPGTFDYVAYKNQKNYGYGELDINATALRWRFYRAADGGLDDEMVMIKQELLQVDCGGRGHAGCAHERGKNTRPDQ